MGSLVFLILHMCAWGYSFGVLIPYLCTLFSQPYNVSQSIALTCFVLFVRSPSLFFQNERSLYRYICIVRERGIILLLLV